MQATNREFFDLKRPQFASFDHQTTDSEAPDGDRSNSKCPKRKGTHCKRPCRPG